ncbi:alanine--tRNA ligase-related protein [Lactobacillus melliventris]|uniref:Alanyl-tRNA synthetase class IIc N-terminal domain-containing protein n=1 Tax=Lactobacillus melliventris TaxID=1218507 RepID=A0A0F4LEU4_9LACO|nr:alanine--tRNA ligase-related protein [Lactobacillus melliventris]KJY57372.1 hypothetical protein JF74_03950 [Lactobacillus melliventris]
MTLKKNDFNKYMSTKGYDYLPEVKLNESKSNTLFVGSSIMGHMDLLDDNNCFKYVTEQRIFTSKRFSDIGKYPLATPFEVMLSIICQEHGGFSSSLSDILSFLIDKIKLAKDRIIFLAPKSSEIMSEIVSIGISDNNIINWEKDLPLYLNDNNKGTYVKLFYPYNNGLMPIGTIGIIKKNSNEFIDSALFLERLSFMEAGKNDWFEDRYFENAIKYLKKSFSIKESRILAINIRAFLILYEDGLRIENNSAGYILKKMLRVMLSELDILNISTIKINSIISFSSKDLELLGYSVSQVTREILFKDLIREINKYNTNQIRALNKLNKINGKGKITSDNLLKLHEENGLSIATTKKWASDNGIALPMNIFDKNNKFWLRNELYKFSNDKNNVDPRKTLYLAGRKRL